jgi:hypothetical protein
MHLIGLCAMPSTQVEGLGISNDYSQSMWRLQTRQWKDEPMQELRWPKTLALRNFQGTTHLINTQICQAQKLHLSDN